MNDYVGKQLGSYKLIEKLGVGGFADVYLGEHIHIKNKKAAIKVLKGMFTEEHIEQFRKEAQTIHNLQHPHIVQVIDFGVTTLEGYTVPFLVMDYAPYGSLSKRHPSGTILPLATILSYLQPIAAALQYAHDQQVIHRDIKPANFLLGKDEQVLLSDFGIAVTAHTTYSTYSMPLQDISGTPAYMAPEQFDGKSRRASDQYALGVIVYEWLCGERPFSGPSFALYALQHKTVPPTSLMKMGATISPSIEQVVLKALEKDPKERFARVQDFADALEQAYHTYVEEITAWLNRSEYTVEMLRSEDVQYALLHRSSAHPEWWKQEGQARINALHQKGEKEADRMVTTVLTALAEKAKSQVVTAVNQENETVFETMLSVMTSCATPSSQYPAVWTSLLHELTSGKAHAFIVKHETVYAELLRQWSSMSPAVDTTLIRPWLPLSWLEFGTLFSLHLPDEWIYIALTPLLDTPIPSEALERIEQSETGLVEGFFRYLLVPQRQSTAMRWFVRLVESGYRGRMSLLHLLLTADLKEQVMQQVMEWVFASPHFTEGERAEILETYGKQFLSYLERSPILLGHIREYLQTFDISGLETSSPTKAFLRSLRDFAQRLPPDIQLTVSSWCEVIDFIDQPITERARLKGLATTISSLPAETYPRLIHMLARTFVSCLEDEFDLINIVDAMSPVLKAETLNLPRNMADIVGKAEKQQHTEMRLIPYIRFALEIEKVYDPLPADQERFVRVFLDSLLQSANDNTFRNLHKLITTQNWPQKAFARWNEYASRRISKLGLQPATSTGPSPRIHPPHPLPTALAGKTKQPSRKDEARLLRPEARNNWLNLSGQRYRYFAWISIGLIIIVLMAILLYPLISMSSHPVTTLPNKTIRNHPTATSSPTNPRSTATSSSTLPHYTAMFGFNPQHTRFNPDEKVLSPASVPHLLPGWTTSTGFWIFSSPAIDDGVVYIGSRDRMLYAFNATTGTKLWSYKTDGGIDSSPAVANGIVYVGSQDHNLYAFDTSVCKSSPLSCKPLWMAPTGDLVESSPTVANGVVYVGSYDGKLYAFNASKGETLWVSNKTGSSIYSSPAVADGVVYIGSDDGKLYAFNASTGTLLWTYSTHGAIRSSPAVANGIVYVGSLDHNLYAFDTSACKNSPPSCKPLWTASTDGLVESSPAVTDDVVYVGSYDGKLYAFSTSTGKTLWVSNKTGSSIYSSPAVANDVVYIGCDDGKLYAFNTSTGTLLWVSNDQTRHILYSSPVVINSTIYIGSIDHTVYTFHLPSTT